MRTERHIPVKRHGTCRKFIALWNYNNFCFEKVVHHIENTIYNYDWGFPTGIFFYTSDDFQIFAKSEREHISRKN